MGEKVGEKSNNFKKAIIQMSLYIKKYDLIEKLLYVYFVYRFWFSVGKETRMMPKTIMDFSHRLQCFLTLNSHKRHRVSVFRQFKYLLGICVLFLHFVFIYRLMHSYFMQLIQYFNCEIWVLYSMYTDNNKSLWAY